jgi:hypothetical protein
VSVVVKALGEPFAHVLVNEGVVPDILYPRVEFELRWQLAVEQEVGDFEERGVLGQLFDRIPAISQDAVSSIEIGDCRGG